MTHSGDERDHIMEFPPNSSPSKPSTSSIPLHLCGFLAGETVHLQGDTGELEFSVQFNVRKKEHQSGNPCDFTDANTPESGNFSDSVQSSPPSPYLTPASTGDNLGYNADANAVSERSWSRSDIVTRLRSGVLTPVKYFSRGLYGASWRSLSPGKRKKSNKWRRKGDNVFEKMLKRRNSPLRPCNPYAFFLIKNWGAVKCSSFVETSKSLSKRWCKLPHDKKKEYEDMAFEDNARYKRQCMLLRNDVKQQATSGLLADFN